MKLAVLFILMISFLSSCGIKGKPLPPIPEKDLAPALIEEKPVEVPMVKPKATVKKKTK